MLRTIGWVVCLALCLVEVGISEVERAEPAQKVSILIQGQVLDAAGHLVPETKATLEILNSTFARYTGLLPNGAGPTPLHRASIDAQGRFQLTAPGIGLYAVRLEAPGYLPLEYVLEPLLHDTALPTAELRQDEGMVVEVLTAKESPAKGARVVATWRDGGPWGLDHVKGQAWGPAARRVQISGDGAAILPYALGEELRVHVMLPGHALWTGSVDAQSVGLDVRLETLRASHELMVMSAGEPMPFALLTHSDVPLALADERGHAAIVPFQRPSYVVVRTAEGHREAVIWKTETAELSLEPRRWRSGRVVDGVTGQPVPGALVWSPRDRHAVQADGNGQFQWATQRPAGNLRAAAPGYLMARFNDVDGGSKSLELKLQGAVEITGRVVTESGQALVGAAVELRSGAPRGTHWGVPGRWQTTSQADGSFRFQGLQPNETFEVWARQDGWVPTYAAVGASCARDAAQRSKSVELVLKRGESLRGRVVDSAFRPIGGVQVEVFSQPAEGSRTKAIDDDGHSAPPTVTDGFGNFEVKQVPRGQHLLLLSAPGWAPRILPRLVVDGPSKELENLILEPGQALELDLTDSAGNAVSRAEVSLRWGLEQASSMVRQSEVQRRVTTQDLRSDMQGRVRADDLPSGRLRVSVSHPDFLPLERNVNFPADTVVITLEPALKLSGRVVDTDDRGLAGLDILAVTQARSLGSSPVAQDLNEAAVEAEGKTDDDGYFELTAVKPGTVQLTVRRSAFVLAQLEMELPPDIEPEPLKVVVDPGTDFQGTVLDAGGEAVVGALVFMGYRDDPSFRLGLTTDAEGHFWVRRAPRGVANLFVNSTDGKRARLQVQVEPGMDPVLLTLEEERALTGRVVDPEGGGVAEAHLHYSTSQFSYRPPVDAEGRFSIPVKGAMDTSLMATRPDMGWVIREVEVPETGDLEPVTLVVPRGVRIVGKVLGASEEEMRRLKTHGVHKTPVQGLGAVRREGRVEPDASFAIQGLMPGRVSVYAEVEGSLRRVREEVEIPTGVDEITVDLDLGDPGLTLSGQVFHNGEPAHTAMVIPGQVETDAEGRFRLDGVQAGTVQLKLIGPWGQRSHSLEMHEDHEVEIHIESYDVSGTVVDESGQPLAEVDVSCWLEIERRSLCEHATDAAGRFDLRELPAGEYQFSFRKEGYGRGLYEVSLQEDVTGLVITLQLGVDVTFSVQSWDGKAVEFLAMDLVGLEGQLPTYKEGFRRDDGLIHVDSLPRGRWQAFITVFGSRVVSLPITAPGGPFPIVLEPGGELTISFSSIERSTKGTLELFDANGNAFTPRDIGKDLVHWPVHWRRAMAQGLTPGTWTYRVSLDDGRTFEGSTTISPGQHMELLLE